MTHQPGVKVPLRALFLVYFSVPYRSELITSITCLINDVFSPFFSSPGHLHHQCSKTMLDLEMV